MILAALIIGGALALLIATPAAALGKLTETIARRAFRRRH